MTEKIFQGQRSWHWWQWTILALIGLFVLFVPIPTGASTPVDRTYRVEASRFEYSPALLKANPGDRLTIELVAMDVVHGLSIDGYNLAATADPGQTTKLTFIADRVGTFRFHCTTTCGNLHPFMIGKLQVGQDTFLLRSIALMGLVLFAGVVKGRK